MLTNDDDGQNAGVPALALQALAHAYSEAVRANRPQVLVRDGTLVRIDGESVTVLKHLTGRTVEPTSVTPYPA